MIETPPPIENDWQKTGQGVHFEKEIADPQSKIWLITTADGKTVLNTMPPNMGTVTEEEALAYAKEKYPGEDVRVKEHHTSAVQEAKEL